MKWIFFAFLLAIVDGVGTSAPTRKPTTPAPTLSPTDRPTTQNPTTPAPTDSPTPAPTLLCFDIPASAKVSLPAVTTWFKVDVANPLLSMNASALCLIPP
jgi:cell division septation protein DedD